MDDAIRRAINEAQVRRYFASWDPTWRWVLLLGLRDLRGHADRLGALAAADVGNDSWADDSYVYGPVSLGITAAAVNEAAQHCEDLFALLSFLREPREFVRRMGSYAAGKVTGLSHKLREEDDWAVAKRFLIPDERLIREGLQTAEDPDGATDGVLAGVQRLGALVREVVDFYLTYEFFHLQYKHGLKLPLRPYSGSLPDTTIRERKTDVKAPLIALSNETLSRMLQRPPSQHAIMFVDPGPEARKHLSELVAERDLLRYQMSGPPVDLDDVVAVSWTVSRLLRLAAHNRQALGEHGNQAFSLPGGGRLETLDVTLALSKPLGLDNFH